MAAVAADVAKLSEAEAWRIVYDLPKPEARADAPAHVCFTGFSPTEKAELAERARRANMHVAKSVTKRLTMLVCGDNAGPAKMERAAAQGVAVVGVGEFLQFLTDASDD